MQGIKDQDDKMSAIICERGKRKSSIPVGEIQKCTAARLDRHLQGCHAAYGMTPKRLGKVLI
jgi:hypothetical protein